MSILSQPPGTIPGPPGGAIVAAAPGSISANCFFARLLAPPFFVAAANRSTLKAGGRPVAW